MYLVQILLPRADNSGLPFPKQEYDEVKEELARIVRRCHSLSACSRRRSLEARREKSDDDIVIFEVMADDWISDIGRNGAARWSGAFARIRSLSAI